MSEIDPQSGDFQSEAKLSEALRHLAASSRHGAPAELGAGLTVAFRQHHRRRRIRRMSVAGLVACVAVTAGVLLIHQSHGSAPNANLTPVAQVHDETPPVAVKTPEIKAPVPVASAKPRLAARQIRPKAATTNATYSRQFMALPGYDPAVPADELHVVRVRAPASALWQMGAPVNPDGYGRKVMADFVVSQDGTPYAVRLVQ